MKKFPFHLPRTRRYCAAFFSILLMWSAGVAIGSAEPIPAPASSPQVKDGGDTAPSGEGAETVLPEVQVTGSKEVVAPPREGSAESGYRYRNADLGPLGERKVLDTPFSIHAVSSELLRNQGAETFSEAVKYLPSVYTEGHFGLEFGPPVVRGLQGDDSAQSVRIDGLNVRADTALPVELYEKLEILYGPASALYGPAPAAGVINAVLKRPTDTPLREIGVGYGSRGNVQGRADIAGRAGGSGWFGYRLNMLYGDGEGYTSDSNLRRALGSVALDFHASDATLIQVSANHYEFDQKGYPGGFSYSNATGLPGAPDPARAGYGQSFGGVDATTDMGELRFDQAFGADWKLRGAVLGQIAKRDFHDTITNTFTDADGAYKTSYRQSGSQANVLSNSQYLNGRVKTGVVSHELALGNVGYQTDTYSIPGLRTGPALILGSASLDNPVTYADPGWGGTGPRYKSSHTIIQSLVLSDTLGLGDHWSVLAAATTSWISTHNWKADGTTTSTYDKNGAWSYSTSLLYKPYTDATLYLTYADSVQPGNNAPSTAANAYQALAPYRSTEWEFGAKASLARFDLTAALFQIRRPFAFTDSADNIFKVDGEQENRGVEFTARGEAVDGLIVVGSLTWLDPRMNSTASAATEGRLVVGVPRLQANLLAEYRLPFMDGAILEGNAHYIGRRAANAENTAWASGYTTLDLGMRYELRLGGSLLTTRLIVANLTDCHYWASLYTGGGWTGDTTASGTAFPGEPRTVKLSMTLAI
jgi:iron complex outermembrane receptor protein